MTRRTPSAEHAKPERGTGVRVWGVCDGSVRPEAHESHSESPSALTVKGSSSPLMKKRREERKNQREKRSKEVNPLALLKLL
ncbi:hypothetical protein [Cutibacterium phage PAVL33]|nr:hypothetical protein [Cutibacterium phage PAVL33]QPB11846.1 hypothetical protein [Cutibacterium phage PAVL34]